MPTPDEERDAVRAAAQSMLAALEEPGLVTRAVLVVEVVVGDATGLSTYSTSVLPWETTGLLDFGRHQLLRDDAREAGPE